MRVMTKFSIAIALALVMGSLCPSSYAIGDQHGVFRSQSTQGATWMGEATIQAEELRMTVHANYVDVELDWVFQVGGTAPAKFQDALEIVGNLNLAPGSVVVGMLTWWKGDILKGKLKTTKMARADYEGVVQRDADAPPPPRDPVLLEYGWGIDNYDISIFPAKFGETRKVRLHYLVPAYAVGGKMKISYPHPFSQNAKVLIKAGSDIASYKLESWNDDVIHTARTMEAIDSRERPSYIIPVIGNEGKGSRVYLGDISTSNFSGQAAQIVVMDAQKVISQSDLKEDFVILWRWSHTRILEKYSGQIVSQSKLLKTFLTKLEGANKRVALIIDKENGERITFKLSKLGDAGYNRLLAYLESLTAIKVVEPPTTKQAPNYQITADANQATKDFESAIMAAMALFENSTNIRHLLLLTAGPQIVYGNTNQNFLKLDSTIQISNLADYAEKFSLESRINQADRDLYWPGINPTNILSKQTLNLEIEAIVSNGSQLCTLSVASKPEANTYYQQSRSEVEKHVYTSTALIPKVTWKISQDNKVIASFEEIPTVSQVENAKDFAKIMGASRALTPMAPQMPHSLAATLGFIDSAYSLAALEEDKLMAADAKTYSEAGVPDLLAADIKPAPGDLFSQPTSEWLKANPIQKLWSYGTSNSWWNGNFRFEVLDMAMAPGGVKMNANPGAFMPFPIAGNMSFSPEGSYPDYSQEIAAGILPAKPSNYFVNFAKLDGATLIFNLSLVNPRSQGKVEIEIYGLNGSLIYTRSLPRLGLEKSFALPLKQTSLKSGIYLILVKSPSGKFQQKILIP